MWNFSDISSSFSERLLPCLLIAFVSCASFIVGTTVLGDDWYLYGHTGDLFNGWVNSIGRPLIIPGRKLLGDGAFVHPLSLLLLLSILTIFFCLTVRRLVLSNTAFFIGYALFISCGFWIETYQFSIVHPGLLLSYLFLCGMLIASDRLLNNTISRIIVCGVLLGIAALSRQEIIFVGTSALLISTLLPLLRGEVATYKAFFLETMKIFFISILAVIVYYVLLKIIWVIFPPDDVSKTTYNVSPTISLKTLGEDVQLFLTYLTVLFFQAQAHIPIFQKICYLALIVLIAIASFQKGQGRNVVFGFMILIMLLVPMYSIGFVSKSNPYRYNGLTAMGLYFCAIFLLSWILIGPKFKPFAIVLGVLISASAIIQMNKAGSTARAAFLSDVTFANNLYVAADIPFYPDRKIVVAGKCGDTLSSYKDRQSLGWNLFVKTPRFWDKTIIESGSADCQRQRLNTVLVTTNHFHHSRDRKTFSGPFVRVRDLPADQVQEIREFRKTASGRAQFQIINDNLYVFHTGQK